MPCYRPLNAWQSSTVNPKTGKRPPVFDLSKGLAQFPVKVPCGQCIDCRQEKARQWATRIVNESQMHEHNHFVTFTYADEHMPRNGNLDKQAIPKFIRKIRKQNKDNPDFLLRYYACAEYGDRLGRPHYHAILHGLELNDLEFFKTNFDGQKYYTSEYMTEAWGKGHVTVAIVNFTTAAYVANYTLKKITGKQLQEKNEHGLTHYQRIDPENGEIVELEPEFSLMSRSPGIGTSWFEKYKDDVYPSDTVIISGVEQKPPAFYDKLLEQSDPELYKKVKAKRRAYAVKQKNIDLMRPIEKQEFNDRRQKVKEFIRHKKNEPFTRDRFDV